MVAGEDPERQEDYSVEQAIPEREDSSEGHGEHFDRAEDWLKTEGYEHQAVGSRIDLAEERPKAGLDRHMAVEVKTMVVGDQTDLAEKAQEARHKGLHRSRRGAAIADGHTVRVADRMAEEDRRVVQGWPEQRWAEERVVGTGG